MKPTGWASMCIERPKPLEQPSAFRYRSAIAAQCAAVSGIREGPSTKLSGATLFPCVKVEQVLEISIDNSRGGRGAGYEARIARIGGKLLGVKAADVGRAQGTA